MSRDEACWRDGRAAGALSRGAANVSCRPSAAGVAAGRVGADVAHAGDAERLFELVLGVAVRASRESRCVCGSPACWGDMAAELTWARGPAAPASGSRRRQRDYPGIWVTWIWNVTPGGGVNPNSTVVS